MEINENELVCNECSSNEIEFLAWITFKDLKFISDEEWDVKIDIVLNVLKQELNL